MQIEAASSASRQSLWHAYLSIDACLLIMHVSWLSQLQVAKIIHTPNMTVLFLRFVIVLPLDVSTSYSWCVTCHTIKLVAEAAWKLTNKSQLK